MDSARAQVADYVELKKKMVAEKIQKEHGDNMDAGDIPVSSTVLFGEVHIIRKMMEK